MLVINVCNKRQNQRVEHGEGPLEFGRGPQRAVKRIMLEDIYVLRDQLLLEESGDGRVHLENLSLKREITLSDGSVLQAGSKRTLALPVFFGVGETQISIERDVTDQFDKASLQTVAQPVARATAGTGAAPPPKLLDLGDSPPPEKLASWMERVITLQQSAADTPDFLKQTAMAVVEMIGLDIAMVILRKNDEWNVAAGHAADDRSSMRFSRTLVSHVLKERRTFYQDLESLAEQAVSLQAVDAVVASPIFGIQEDVVGILYAARNRAVRGRIGIRPLEAQVVQLLAAAVSANLARAAAVRTRVQFEQFFSPELVRELERNPNLLEGRNQDVTILVSDLRGFTSLSERLGAGNTCKIIQDLMEHMTERIVSQGGVIVDYAGDGILAMWNAPVLQSDHAVRACRAAQSMQAEMAGINLRWQETIGAPLILGIGINTGMAQVGNTGCSRKFKYGPHGHTVNLAARVQDATKKLGIPVLITASVRDKVKEVYMSTEAGHVQLSGVKDETPLFELKTETGSITRT